MKKQMMLFVIFILIMTEIYAQTTWTQIAATTEILYDVFFINGQTGWICGRNGFLCKSTDGGFNWNTVNIGTGDYLYSIYFLNEMTGYIGGDNDMWKTTDGGQNWQPNYLGLVSVLDVTFINNNTGWVCGRHTTAQSYAAYTTNAGANWIESPISSTNNCWDIKFINANTGFTCNGTEVFKTTNAGLNWTAQTRQGEILSFINETTGWLLGYNPSFKTTDGGNSWFSVGGALGIDGKFIDALNGRVVHGNGIIRRTVNGGQNWFVEQTGITGSNFNSIFYLSPDTIFVVGTPLGNTGVVLRTINGTSINPPGAPANLNALAVSGSQINLTWTDTNSLESGFKIQRSTNAGANWVLKDSVPANTYTFADTGLNANTIYHYRIYAYNPGGNSPYSNISYDTTFSLTGFIPIKEIPVSFSLSQNYPNPFNPATKIKFSVPAGTSFGEAQDVRLIIYDVTGKEVVILVNEQLQPGTYEIDWSPGNYSSGIYYYKLISAEYTETKMAILIK